MSSNPKPNSEAASHGQSTTINHNYKKSYPPAEADYEEIAQNPDFFLEKLKGFHGSFGSKIKIPTIGGKALDLYRLFLEVTARGGIEKVIRDRKWKEVYYFRKEVPSIPLDDPASRIPINGSVARHVFEDGAMTNQWTSHADFILEPGSSVAGIIDAKFDGGYLITVNLGSEKLKGVIYHTPTSLHASQNSKTSAEPPHRECKRYQLAIRDPSQPTSNSSGYNFFFAEHYSRLKPLYHGKEKAIGKKIGVLWSRLTDAEKQVYQDKERQGERQE